LVGTVAGVVAAAATAAEEYEPRRQNSFKLSGLVLLAPSSVIDTCNKLCSDEV
jgi:hypothetical protein